MVAIHNRVLTEQQILQNFDVGVGQKFFMLFSISHLIDLEQSYVMYQVRVWDNYAYLFEQPTFINLDDQAIPDNIDLEDLRIMVNSKVLNSGQAYKTIKTQLNANDYNPITGQLISRVGTIVPLERGPESDWFSLAFGKIGNSTNTFAEPEEPDESSNGYCTIGD